jgi:hypothetical protein
VVVGEDEHLGLARETSKGRGVKDAVAVALETRAELVGLFLAVAVAATHAARGPRGQERVEEFLARSQRPGEGRNPCAEGRDRRGRVAMRHGDVVRGALVPAHGRRPAPGSLGDGFYAHVFHIGPWP